MLPSYLKLLFTLSTLMRFQGKSLAIVTKIVDFSDGIQAQTYTMFASEKVSERNENCKFQPAYVRKAIIEESC
jgi:hypothetical protein